MSEERTPRGGPRPGSGARGPAGSGSDGFGGAGFGGAGVPRQPRDYALGAPSAGGGGRRRAAPAQFGEQELAAALRHSVAAVGASGPPRAGLARIRRRAKARQRRRTVMAGSAGVLLIAVAVSAVTGNSFNIVPVLTGVVGLGGSHSSSGENPDPQGGTGSGVRTVRPPADAAGKKGPAIGPGGVSGVPTALAATGLPQCSASDLTTVTTVDAVIGGVAYGHVEAVAQRACAVAGPPVLQVENAAGTAASSVVLLRHEQSDGAQLPSVGTWGAVLALKPGDGYDLQFAWAPDGCGDSASASASATSATGTTTAGSSPDQASASAYTLSYLIGNATPTEPVDLSASCGATVYVTDIYPRGEYPLAKATDSPSAQPSVSSAPATTPSPTGSPSTAPTTAGSSAAAPSSSASSSSGSAGSSPAAGAPTATSPQQPQTRSGPTP